MNLYPFMTRVSVFAALTAFALFAGGCGGFSGFCTADIERGIEVSVYDAQTHAPIASGAVGTIQDGGYTETLTPAGGDLAGNLISIGGAQERPGTYTVNIGKTGYQTWVMQNVRVTKGDCHVNRVTLEADLQPTQ